MDIIYITQLVPESIEETRDLKYSVAQDNKSKVILKNLEQNHNVTVLSTVSERNDEFGVTNIGEITYSRSNIKFPCSINIFGNPYIYTLSICISTIFLVLKHIFKKDDPMILFYNFDVKSALPAYIGAISSDIPILLEYEDGFFVKRGIFGYLCRSLYSLLDPLLSGAICCNYNLSNRLRTSNTTVLRGKPSIWLNNTDCNENFNPDRKPCRVVYSGRFDQTRGVFSFLEVAQQLSDNYPDIAFAVSGYGPASEEVKNICSDLQNVRYYGKLPWGDYSKLLQRSDIYINPQDPNINTSKYQFPSKLLDYMASNGVIISTNMGDLERLCDELVLVSNNEDEISNTILDIYQNPDEYDSYRKKSNEYLQKYCSDEYITDCLNNLIHNLK